MTCSYDVLFVFDLTEECGCDVQQQWLIRHELQCRFPHKLWIDVITKTVILAEELDQAALLGTQGMPDSSAVPEDAVQAVCSVASLLASCRLRLVCMHLLNPINPDFLCHNVC
jgi:GTP1/Obg family GTP-binding protein